MLIRITKLPESAHVDDFDLRMFRVGTVYDVGRRLAEVLILMGYAEPQPDRRQRDRAADKR